MSQWTDFILLVVCSQDLNHTMVFYGLLRLTGQWLAVMSSLCLSVCLQGTNVPFTQLMKRPVILETVSKSKRNSMRSDYSWAQTVW